MKPERSSRSHARAGASVVLSIIVALASLGLTPAGPARAAGVIFVRPGGLGSGTSWPNAFPSLQDALAAAVSGDEIWVAAGTYTPGSLRTDTFQLKNGVAVYGGFAGAETLREQRDWAANVVTLSGDLLGDDGPSFANNAENSYHVVTGATGATLDGVTISGGNANSALPHGEGGGMFNNNSSPTLSNVTINGNSARSGGGMFNNNSSSPTLTNVTFSANCTTGSGDCGSGIFFLNGNGGNGGGMFNLNSSNPTLTNVTFTSNLATSRGGGMYNNTSTSPTLNNVTFSNNTGAAGGGIYNEFISDSPKLNNVTFSGNSSFYFGGGMANMGSPTLSNVTFSRNTAGTNGAGILNTNSGLTLTNAIFSGNSTAASGGGIANWNSSPVLSNVTFSGNSAAISGGGVYNTSGSNPQIHNSIIWGNTAPSGPAILNDSALPPSNPTISYSLVEGGYPGAGNLDADPLFVAPVPAAPSAGGDLHLRAASPAIDTGSDGLVPPDITTDRDGVPRIIDLPGAANSPAGTVDMGAYEVQFPSVLSITRAGASPTNAAAVAFTVTFNMPVSGIGIDDLALTTAGGQGGASISQITGNPKLTIWAVTVNTAAGQAGTIRLDLIDNDSIVTADALHIPLGGPGAGNGDFSSGEAYEVDRAAPTVSLSSSASDPTSTSPITVSVTFSESVVGFTAGDIVAGNATVGSFSGGGAAYAFELTPLGDGPVTADIAAGAAADAVGNPSRAAAQLSRSYVSLAPAPSRVYLPLVSRPGSLGGPDLVVEQIRTAGGRLTVTIANIGDTAAAAPFWLDLMIDPDRAPARVNDTWDAVGSRGLSWCLSAPLAPGARLTLSVGDVYYRADSSRPGGPILPGATLYAHVDAVSAQNLYGGVEESHERLGQPYNNILGPVRAEARIELAAAAPAATGLPRR